MFLFQLASLERQYNDANNRADEAEKQYEEVCYCLIIVVSSHTDGISICLAVHICCRIHIANYWMFNYLLQINIYLLDVQYTMCILSVPLGDLLF